MSEIFKRVDRFLKYLGDQEDREYKERELEIAGGLIGRRFVPHMRLEVDKERKWIEYRLRENREKFLDDYSGTTLGELGLGVATQERFFGNEGD